MAKKTSKKTTDQKASEAVIALQQKLDKAEAEIKRLKKVIALTSWYLKVTARCLGDENG